jgi:hypothetical protein
MDEFTTTKVYLRIQTGVAVTVTALAKKEWKGKEKLNVTLQADTGELIDAAFQLPMNDITKKQYAKLLKAAHVAEAKELVGKRIGIQINKSEYNGRFYYNPSHFFPVTYLEKDGDENVKTEDNFDF